jgi:hypothetical protein
MSASSAPSCKHIAPARRFHSSSKAVNPRPLTLFWLKGHFHLYTPPWFNYQLSMINYQLTINQSFTIVLDFGHAVKSFLGFPENFFDLEKLIFFWYTCFRQALGGDDG